MTRRQPVTKKAKTRGPVNAFVLRSGYVVAFDPDMHEVMNHLKQAILGESLGALRRKRKKTWDAVAKEIHAESEHIAKTMHPDFAQALLADLLADIVFDLLRTVAAEHDLEPPSTETIH